MVTYEERQEYQYHLEKKLFKSARKRGHNNLKSIGCQLSTRHVYVYSQVSQQYSINYNGAKPQGPVSTQLF